MDTLLIVWFGCVCMCIYLVCAGVLHIKGKREPEAVPRSVIRRGVKRVQLVQGTIEG